MRPHVSQPTANASRAASTPAPTRSESAAPTTLNVSTNTAAMMAKKHGMPTPANDFFYEKIREIEAGYHKE